MWPMGHDNVINVNFLLAGYWTLAPLLLILNTRRVACTSAVYMKRCLCARVYKVLSLTMGLKGRLISTQYCLLFVCVHASIK